MSQRTNQIMPAQWILVRLWRHKLLIGGFFLGVVGNAALAALLTVLIGIAFNAALASPPDLTLIGWVAIGILISQIVRALLQFERVLANAVLSERLERDARQEVYASLLGKSIAFHDMLPAGETMARVTNDTHELNLMIKFGVGVIAASASFLLTPLLVAPYYNKELILEPVLFIVGYVCIVIRYLRVLRSVTDRTRQTFGVLNRRLVEALDGIEVIKGAAQEEQEYASFKVHTSACRDAVVEQGRVEARFLALLLLGLIQGLGFAHALWLTNRGEINVGDVAGYTGLLFLLGFPTFSSLAAYSRVALGFAAVRRILAIIQGGGEQDEPAQGYEAAMKGHISFEHVSFGYTKEHDILHDLHFTIEPGQTVALVGEIGAGKTTLTKLLNRTYDVSAGRILIDMQDIREWSLPSLRQQVAVIEQDIFLFSRTIAENIAFGVPNATREMIQQAAQMAQAHDFIMNFEDGYDTLVGTRGVTLSGGQQQRIVLARALLTQPRILILDDATSAVDSATEDQIQQAIGQASLYQTTILITNRLSQIRSADMILVLSQGRLEACGSHEELLQRSPSYQRLFRPVLNRW